MRRSRKIRLGSVEIGGGAPVSIQSMTNTDTSDVEGTMRQIRELAAAGCEIVRCTVPDMAAAEAYGEIVRRSPVPVVADIHFDADLAMAALDAGSPGIRINPGNLKDSALKKLAERAGECGAVIRVGANSGSVRKSLLEELKKSGRDEKQAMAEALCQSALEQCRLLEQYGFDRIKVSLKASDVPVCVAAYERFAAMTDYPLHLGVTEAGTPGRGVVKSAVGIGALLLRGIGDTIRVSLTAPPVSEVGAALRILESCGLRPAEPEIVSCPTCGRTTYDLVGAAEEVEAFVASLKASGRRVAMKKIAVMGCAVNGPGEARDADAGIAGAKNGEVVLFRHGVTGGAYSLPEGLAKLKELIALSAK